MAHMFYYTPVHNKGRQVILSDVSILHDSWSCYSRVELQIECMRYDPISTTWEAHITFERSYILFVFVDGEQKLFKRPLKPECNFGLEFGCNNWTSDCKTHPIKWVHDFICLSYASSLLRWSAHSDQTCARHLLGSWMAKCDYSIQYTTFNNCNKSWSYTAIAFCAQCKARRFCQSLFKWALSMDNQVGNSRTFLQFLGRVDRISSWSTKKNGYATANMPSTLLWTLTSLAQHFNRN